MTNPGFQDRHTRRAHSEYPDELQAEAVPGRSPDSDPTRTIPIVTHTRMPPAAVVRAQSSCAHRCIPHGQPNEHTAQQAEHIGRQGPLCATVTWEDQDAHLPSEYDGFEATAD